MMKERRARIYLEHASKLGYPIEVRCARHVDEVITLLTTCSQYLSDRLGPSQHVLHQVAKGVSKAVSMTCFLSLKDSRNETTKAN